jgi:hypothetical protein
MRHMTMLTLVASPCIVLAMGGCFGKHPGPWRAASPTDLETLRDHYKIETANRDIVRRDVSVWVIGPASGYPEWGVKREDGSVQIVAPEKSRH